MAARSVVKRSGRNTSGLCPGVVYFLFRMNGCVAVDPLTKLKKYVYNNNSAACSLTNKAAGGALRMRMKTALTALLMAACVLSMPVNATNTDTDNDFTFEVWEGDKYVLVYDLGVNIIPADFSDTENTIPMRGTVVPCFKFVSENFDELGINDSRTGFGSVTIIRYDDESVANETAILNYNKIAITGDMAIMKAEIIKNCTQQFEEQTVPCVTAYGANIDDLVKRDIGSINRGVCETRVVFGNFVVCLITDEEHFQTALESLSLRKKNSYS